ncbi:anti-sigma factor [Thalassiella azotivora]
MPHCDPEALALLALGEDVDVDREHLRGCAQCSEELSSLRTVVGVGRRGPAPLAPVTPPPSVWAGIAAATGVSASPRADDGGGADAGAPDGTAGTGSSQDTGSSGDTGGSGDAAVVTLAPRQREAPREDAPTTRTRSGRWPSWALAAAAAVGAVAGAGGLSLVTGSQEGDPVPDAPATVAAADLEALQTSAGPGAAEVVDDAGERYLVVRADALPTGADGFYEVWLLAPDVSGMVQLGVLRGDSGRFPLPDDLDLDAFPVVDVSFEPLDGDPTHSGDSLLRGTLGT